MPVEKPVPGKTGTSEGSSENETAGQEDSQEPAAVYQDPPEPGTEEAKIQEMEEITRIGQ